MLEKDLQAIQRLISESESRMITRMEADAKESESRMLAYMEAAIMPKFELLADGQKLLKETLAPKSRVEELEEEVAFLKPIVMSMLTDIDKLKKAQ